MSNNPLSHNSIAASLAAALGGLTVKAEPFEGLATLIPNPVEESDTHVLVLTNAGLFYCMPNRGARNTFSAARDLAFEVGGVDVRVDAVGSVHFCEAGYTALADGTVVAADEETLIADLGNFAKRTYSAARNTGDDAREFGSLSLYLADKSAARRARARTKGERRYSQFGEDVLNAVQASVAVGDFDRLAGVVSMLLVAFPNLFGGVNEMGLPAPKPGSIDGTTFATAFAKVVTGRVVKAAPTTDGGGAAEKGEEESETAEQPEASATVGGGAPAPAEQAPAAPAPAAEDSVLDPGF